MKFTMKGLNILFFFYLFLLFELSINFALCDSRYSIKDILIQIDTENIANVRNSAILKAQKEAYKQMIQPIIHPDDLYKVFPIENNLISSLVSGIELTDEVILENKYKAYFTINFNQMRVNDFFRKNQILYSVTESKPISLLPIINSNLDQVLIENSWNSSWIKNNLEKDIFNLDIVKRTELKIPIQNVENLLSLNISEEPEVKNRNNTIFIWANFFFKDDNTMEMNVIVKSIFNKTNKTFTVNFNSLSNEKKDNFINRTVKSLQQKLFNQWILSTATIDTTISYKFRFLGSNLKKWRLIENKLSNIESIKKVNIEYYEIGNLKGTINFAGGPDKLNLILSENDIALTFLGEYFEISLKR